MANSATSRSFHLPNGSDVTIPNSTLGFETKLPPLGWRLSSDIMHIVAIFTNLAFVIAVRADRTSKAGPRLLIANLALCGFLFTAGLFPVFVIQNWLPPSYIPSQCDVTTAILFFMTVISWADVCLAINRTVAICFPHHFDAFQRRRVTWVLIGSAWTISIIIAILVRTETGLTFIMLERGACSMIVRTSFAQFYTSMCTIVPYLIMGGASIGIFSTAHIRLKRPSENVLEAQRVKRTMQRRLVIAKAMALSLLWNVLCSLPSLLILSAFAEDAKKYPWLNSVISLSNDTLYAFNPVIYFWISPAYRQTFLQATVHRFPAFTRKTQVDPSDGHSRTRSTQKQRRTLPTHYS